MSKAIVLRVKFPQTFPVIYKTIRMDSGMVVDDALRFIADAVRVPFPGDVGLYLPEDKTFLDNDKTLADFPELAEQVLIMGLSLHHCHILPLSISLILSHWISLTPFFLIILILTPLLLAVDCFALFHIALFSKFFIHFFCFLLLSRSLIHHIITGVRRVQIHQSELKLLLYHFVIAFFGVV